MVKKICNQREVIPVAVFDIKRAARNGVVTIGDAGRNRVLPCDFKNIRPVNRPDFRVAIVASQRDPEPSVANGQAQNFPFMTFVGVQQFSQKLSRMAIRGAMPRAKSTHIGCSGARLCCSLTVPPSRTASARSSNPSVAMGESSNVIVPPI